ncbi:hypothetical protein DGo_CA1958 [Deinococcus gobiensis I-0]|uniref:Helix-hairpin-helix DNA-binding motif class 1 domain-containing protein n=1 Tax=Deinococcus gobiensis (strain DSM 21396 / JCM 16679 / CGMCC 1.7299 / I-0) TaxID=745776 RepID=H8GXN3_DEIGI|nr:hypothetical protein DGo_CA1958 [Deinococcus gobiensis I-0]
MWSNPTNEIKNLPGIGQKLAKRVIEDLGEGDPHVAIVVIERNPFNLQDVDGIGFKKADRVAKEVYGLGPDDVRCALVIRSKQDGAPRRLSLTLKNSKMKDFVPVAIFTKYGVASDNLTQLFDTGRYGQHELLLIVEVVEDREEKGLDFDAAPVTPTWVLEELLRDDLARERMLDEGCPNCPDIEAPTLAPVPPRVVLAPRESGEDLPFPIEETETDLVGLGLN